MVFGIHWVSLCTLLYDALMFEFAHSQMEASRECPAIDIPKTLTNNIFLNKRDGQVHHKVSMWQH